MDIKIIENSTFPLVEADLSSGDQIVIEKGSMIYHNGEVELKGTLNSNGQKGIGRMIRALGRSFSSGEDIFCTTVTGKTNTAKIGFAPTLPGEIKILNIGEQQWRLNTSSFLACESGVSYNMQKQSIKSGLFGSGGLFVMETQGKGKFLINSYGSIVKIYLTDDKPFIIDNNHVLAWSTTLNYNVRVGSGIFGFTTGEGLVNEFHGKGTVLVQTRTIQGFAGLLSPFISNNSEMEKDFDSV